MIFNNPYERVLKAVNNLYGDIDVIIDFDDSIRRRFFFFGCWGVTIFPEDDHGTPIIRISAHLPVMHSLEILAHELAHVKAGIEAGHGDLWQLRFDEIYDETVRLANA